MGDPSGSEESFPSYPSARLHGLIGDRRAAALVAADGTIDWLCHPGFDGYPVFGALLDAKRGGFWKLGPRPTSFGAQEWEAGPILRTVWRARESELELLDALLLPEDERERGLEGGCVVLRRLRCARGRARCLLHLRSAGRPALWLSRRLGGAERAAFTLGEGEELWAVASFGDTGVWSVARARRELARCRAHWDGWRAGLSVGGPRAGRLLSSAQAIRLLVSARTGAMAAAPTTSLPERIGGDWNADYRLCWLRDTSIALGALARLGDLEPAKRWLSWVLALPEPFQPVYRLDGATRAPRREQPASGFRESRPVVFGNNAYRQTQNGAAGFLADFLHLYRERTGVWDERCAGLVERLAARTLEVWREPDNGLWELPEKRHYTASKALCWLALRRCAELGCRLEGLERAAGVLKEEALARGWDPRRGSFRQRYDADALDSSTLLLPLIGLLPASDPRAVSNLDRIAESLSIDGFVYRFRPEETPGIGKLPLGAFEGAFIPSTMWLASAQALAGRVEDADETLARVERSSGPSGLLAEAVDPLEPGLLGNYPLAFSHAEHILAILRWRDRMSHETTRPRRRPSRRARARRRPVARLRSRAVRHPAHGQRHAQ